MRQRRGVNLQSVKWQNRGVVLETLWRHQPLSRKDLADRTHLTAATLTNIIAEFLAFGIVQEIGPGEPGRGRRPTLLSLVPDSAYVVGINISRTDINVGIFDMALDRQHLLVFPVDITVPLAMIDVLVELIQRAIDESEVEVECVVGIGISGFGPLGRLEEEAVTGATLDHWSKLPLRQALRQAFRLPVWIENDANADTLAEYWLGAGKPFNNFLYVESHSGLGAGVIWNGRLYTGCSGIAGELGHTSVNPQGPQCACGNYGCVELYSSGPAIVRRVRECHAGGRLTTLIDVAGPDLAALTFDHVIQAARQDDPLAREVIDAACHALGLSLVTAVNLLDPEAIIIGYELNRMGDECLRPIRALINERAFPQAAANVHILAGELTEFVGLTGAACCALNGVFQEPYLLLDDTSALA